MYPFDILKKYAYRTDVTNSSIPSYKQILIRTAERDEK